MAPSRRKQRLIKPGLQLKSAFTFLGLAVTFVFIQALLLMQTLTKVAGTLPNEGALVLDGLPRTMATNVLLMAGVMVPLFLFVGVRSTFRVAGPLARFEDYLRRLREGQQPGPCSLRDGDGLQDFCQLLNEATAPLRGEAPASASSSGSEVEEASPQKKKAVRHKGEAKSLVSDDEAKAPESAGDKPQPRNVEDLWK